MLLQNAFYSMTTFRILIFPKVSKNTFKLTTRIFSGSCNTVPHEDLVYKQQLDPKTK